MFLPLRENAALPTACPLVPRHMPVDRQVVGGNMSAALSSSLFSTPFSIFSLPSASFLPFSNSLFSHPRLPEPVDRPGLQFNVLRCCVLFLLLPIPHFRLQFHLLPTSLSHARTRACAATYATAAGEEDVTALHGFPVQFKFLPTWFCGEAFCWQAWGQTGRPAWPVWFSFDSTCIYIPRWPLLLPHDHFGVEMDGWDRAGFTACCMAFLLGTLPSQPPSPTALSRTAPSAASHFLPQASLP